MRSNVSYFRWVHFTVCFAIKRPSRYTGTAIPRLTANINNTAIVARLCPRSLLFAQVSDLHERRLRRARYGLALPAPPFFQWRRRPVPSWVGAGSASARLCRGGVLGGAGAPACVPSSDQREPRGKAACQCCPTTAPTSPAAVGSNLATTTCQWRRRPARDPLPSPPPPARAGRLSHWRTYASQGADRPCSSSNPVPCDTLFFSRAVRSGQ